MNRRPLRRGPLAHVGRPSFATICVVAWLGSAMPADAQVPVTVGGGGAPMTLTMPPAEYFGSCGLLYDGSYQDALRGFQSCIRGAFKFGTNYWIDSICYHTMAAECYYRLGQYGPALESNARALQFAANPELSKWMITVNFAPSITPRSQPSISPVPWGQPQRQFLLGHFPNTVSIRIGQIDQSAVVVRGGVVQQAMNLPINAQEIVRCTCLALRRRRDLLGPAAANDVLLKQMVAVLSKRPVQPNHWSEAWIDVQLGCAFAALGNDAQAKPLLEKSIITGGQFDHPMTSIALVELGRIALNAGDPALAMKFFQEASYSAYYFVDPLICEDALRAAATTHMAANRPGPYAPLAPAADWARREDYRQLQAAMIALAAENQCVLNQAKAAATMLDNGRAVTVRSDIPKSRLGAELNFVQALVNYQLGNVAAGDSAINAALAFEQTGCLKLFHMALVERSTIDRSLTPRMAKDAFERLLRDPLPNDWMVDPLETLATLAVPHPAYYERWLELSLESKELDGRKAVEIADLAKRHRFLSTQELGGRLLNLRWLLEGPPESLSQQAALQRQSLLTAYPDYEKLSQQARDLRAELAQGRLVIEDSVTAKKQAAKLAELDQIVRNQETMLKVMAVRRLPVDLVFPPVRTTADVQKALPDGHALLTFFVGMRGTIGFLMTNDKFGYWPIIAPADVQKKLVALLQALGNYDESKVMTSADLGNDSWRQLGRDLLDVLTKDSKAEIPYGFRELIVVPDGYTWYVPFEALSAVVRGPTARGDAQQGANIRPLIEQLPLRYAPTVGLAVGDVRQRLDRAKALVSIGRLHPGDDDAVAEQAFAELTRAAPQSEALRLRAFKTAAGGALFASLADRLIVLADINPSPNGPQQWAPLTGEKAAVNGTLADWARLPWHGPEHIALPGFHTAAENALKKVHGNADLGNDLFLATTGLMAAGARTVLISRWRPGGQTSYDLVREFMQEVPFTAAARAWQRSVLLARQTPITPPAEPRIRLDSDAAPPPPDHPFFWGGYLVVDTGTEPAVDAEEAAKQVIQAVPKAAAVGSDDQPAGKPADKAANGAK